MRSSKSSQKSFALFAWMPWSTILFILFHYLAKMSSFFFFFFFLSKRSTKNNILVRSSLTRVSLFALWPPHLIPGGAGWVFFFLFWHPSGSRWLVVTVAQKTNKKNGRSHYCRHFFLFRDSLYIFSSLQGKLEPSVPLSLDCRFSIFASLGPEIKSKSHLF